MEIVGQRTVDLDEIERLITPFVHHPAMTLVRPGDSVEISATLRGSGDSHAHIRTAALQNGNAAIEAIEHAGYEHVAAPQINIDGIEVTPLDKRFDYLTHAELRMELIGKRS